MYQVKCIEKIRDKSNHIIKYELVNKNRKITHIKSDGLKEAIRSGQIEVVNLTLTSDNRLIDKKSDTQLKPVNTHSKQINNIENLLNRLRSLGYTINTFDTACDHKCYIASSIVHLKHILVIPDDVRYIYNLLDQDIYSDKLYHYMSNIKGALKVIGGKNLILAQGIFWGCGAHSIDLSSFNTDNVTDMSTMFKDCRVHFLDLRSFNTSNVIDMSYMFYDCKAQSINLSSFDTSNVTNMNDMFLNCKAYSIDLTSFNTSNVTDMRWMFNGCNVKSLDLTSFDTSKVTNMSYMFHKCEARSLDLSSFNTSGVTDMSFMFYECRAQSIDLSSFNISKETTMRFMFQECRAQINVTDPKLKDQLQKDKEEDRLWFIR